MSRLTPPPNAGPGYNYAIGARTSDENYMIMILHGTDWRLQ